MSPFYDRVKEWLSVELADPSLAAGDPVVSGFLLAGARATSDGTLTDRATSLAQLFGPELNASLATGEATGFFRIPYATQQGKRRGSRERIVETADGGFPLTVSTGSFVTRVVFDGGSTPRATGVEYRRGHALYAASADHDPAGPYETLTARADEVVLAAGAFNTPQILMLSGVGDPEVLGALGIDALVARKGVGANLQDRYEAGVVAELDRPIDLLARCRLGEDADSCLDAWKENGTGVYSTPGFLATALVRATPDAPLANLQIFAVPADARGYYPGCAALSAAKKDRFSWLVLEGHTHGAVGFVRPVSADPSVRPRIQKNVFDRGATLDDPELAAMVRGIRVVRDIHVQMRKDSPGTGFREIWPGPEVATDAQIASFVARETWGHHVCCTAKMGTPDDDQAVVDSHFRVLGASHLRVVDASIFPEIPGTFIALPLYMMSEKAAETILEDMR
jgi:choline dehydrogenase